MQPLTLHLIQADLAWENETENIRHLTRLAESTTADSIVILPEMFATGFTMKPENFATTMGGKAVQWMLSLSVDRVVCGSLAVEEGGKFYNRFIWAQNGEIKGVYDKRHLFGHGNEHRHYTSGSRKLQMEYRGWKIAPYICYDLRFPVWSRNNNKTDLMIFVANWPQVRIKAWKRLLQARAIENQCFVAAVNRVGEDGKGIFHDGQSAIADPWGEWIKPPSDGEQVITSVLNPEILIEFRNQFPVLDDQDEFRIL